MPTQLRKTAKSPSRTLGKMHVLQLYDEGSYPVESLAGFLWEGIQKGEGAAVILTSEHTRAVRGALGKRGARPEVLSRNGRAIFLDADAALRNLMVRGHPDRHLFGVFGSKIEAVIPRGGIARVVGEMAPLLVARGFTQAAIRLEGLWDHYFSRRPVASRCIYPISLFTDPSFTKAFYLIADTHSKAIPILEGKPEPQSEGEWIAGLQYRERTLAASGELMRLLARYFMRAREDERTRISRTVHDELGQDLVSVLFDLRRLSDELGHHQVRLAKTARRSISTVEELIHRTNRVANELRPTILDDLGLHAAIEWLVEDFQARTGITGRVSLPHRIAAPDAERATEVFRIFQEALSNVARHSHAKRVAVRVVQKRHGLVVSIRDDGIGITAEQLVSSTSLGLIGMRERAAIIGARLDITGIPGRGTKVLLHLPGLRKAVAAALEKRSAQRTKGLSYFPSSKRKA